MNRATLRAPLSFHRILDRTAWLVHRISKQQEQAGAKRFRQLWQREARVRRIAHEMLDFEFARMAERNAA